MKNLSILIPTKNEESNIKLCILSAQNLANEIVVIDSYSTDKTVEIAQSLGAKIIFREFDNFSNQKNWAIPQMANQWILLLDADERITRELEKEILSLISSNELESHNAYWIYRQNHFFNQPINYSGFQKDKVIRLFHRDKCRYNNKKVHEEIITEGSIGFLKNKLYHNTYKGFDYHIEKLNQYATLQAEDYNKKTGKLGFYHFVFKPSFRFFKHYIIQKGYKDGIPGFIMSFLGFYAVILRYIKVWMLRNDIKN